MLPVSAIVADAIPAMTGRHWYIAWRSASRKCPLNHSARRVIISPCWRSAAVLLNVRSGPQCGGIVPCPAGAALLYRALSGRSGAPRVYTAEAAAQAADILMVTAGRYAGKLPLFMGIERARFRQKILPGDTLEIHVALQEELEKRAIAACRGEVYAGSLLAAELEIRLAFRRGGERKHTSTPQVGSCRRDLPRPTKCDKQGMEGCWKGVVPLWILI